MAYTPKLTYKGRPLVRCGNDIYYGSMKDPFVVYLQVLSTKKENGVDVADKVHIVLLSTDESKSLPERIARQANKVGLYNALGQGLRLVGGEQDDVHLIGHVDAVFLLGGEHLQVNDERIFHGAVVDIVAAAHQRAALIGQFRGICHI